MKGDFDKAVALKYLRSMPAPFVIAKGRKQQAEMLIRIAEENGVTIFHKPELAESLFLLDIAQMIPESLYEIVAEILAFVYSVEVKKDGTI